MNTLTALTVPIVLLLVGGFGLYKKTDIYDALVTGAGDGLRLLTRILPSVVALFVAIYMLRASGALDFICSLLAPAAGLLGIPRECTPLILLRPLSGSAGLAFGSEIMKNCGVDSYVGRTETTFYTIAVYFGATGIKHTRHAVPAALCADLSGFIAAALAVRLFFG